MSSVTPTSLTLSGNGTFFTVIYIVTALGNSTGFYNYGGIGPGCEDEALAVGFSASQVNASDFSLPTIGPECPASPFFPFNEYLTGMSVTFIKGPYGAP